MPRTVPRYRPHKGSKQACVSINGRDVYLGVYGSPESYAKYHALIAQHYGGKLKVVPVTLTPATGWTVELAVDRLKRERLPELSKKDRHHFETVTAAMVAVFGNTRLDEFGPLKYEEVRKVFLARGWCRRHVNRQCGRMKEVLRWFVGKEMYPAEKLAAVREVPGLRAGKTTAKEGRQVTAVPISDVMATLPHVPRPVRGIILFQLWTGCRPGEAVIARREDINTDGCVTVRGVTLRLADIWVYQPTGHKNDWREQGRFVLIGPQGQEALREFVECSTGYLFRPADVAKAPNPGPHYQVESYNRAIGKGAARASVPHWHAYQLRYTAAQRVRDSHGEEAAKEVLGHKHLDMTAHYTGIGLQKAADAIRKVG